MRNMANFNNDEDLETLIKIQDRYQYGKQILRREYLLQKDLTNFNHGSFGTVPKDIMDRHIALLLEQESCPETWFREIYFKYLNEGRRKIAELIHAALEDVVLVENASTAVNSILRSFSFQPGDVVLVFSSAYRMVKDTLRFLNHHQQVEMIEIPIPYPLHSEGELIDIFQVFIQRHKSRLKLCVFSHISSMPTMIEPIHALTTIAKSYGSLVLIDGAHAPGVLDIFVETIGCDYYTGNCHKWLYGSKGSAFLWTSRGVYHPQPFGNEDDIHPQPVVISSTGKYGYVGRFEYTGTRDYVAFCALPECFDFIEKKLGGFPVMQQYCRLLLRIGCDYLVKEWNTGYLIPLTMNGFMANVILPSSSQETLSEMQRRLLKEYNLTMVFEKVPARIGYGGEKEAKIFFMRVSTQVYLEMNDFHFLAAAVNAILSASP